MTFVLVSLIGLCAIGVILHQSRSPSPPPRQGSPALARVKRRRKLQRKLHKIVGDEAAAAELATIEARRLKVSPSSIEALTAATERATTAERLE